MDTVAAQRIGFIGGGHMAAALIGGLVRSGHDQAALVVVEPDEAARERLLHAHGVRAQAAADTRLAGCDTVVWAVKPQFFAQAAAPCAAHVAGALQLSVMAGVRCATIAAATGSLRIVRTPALIGQGIAGLYAEPAVSAAGRDGAEALLAPTGGVLWVAHEADLDAVTALSGSGPAYVFYFLEAMMQAAVEMGLSPEQGRALGQATFAGAAALAMRSDLSPAALREQVTSKGGTTHAAITSLDADGVKTRFVKALHAARARAEELGRG
jgi:pyrroline-5-carboxylate reductase